MRIRFDRGTLVLEAERTDEDPAQIPGATWDGDVHAWRVPAQFHRDVIVRYSDSQVRISDGVNFVRLVRGDWQLPELRWYQRAALAQWEAADRCGVIALPTGSGKTLVALAAIEKLGVGALVIVPTRVLLDQWVKALATFSAHAIGRIGDGDHRIEPITVSTYASAISWVPRIGDQFGLVVVDEAHHVGAWCPAEILEMLPAHARLGLTATPPPESQSELLQRHVGPVVYSLGIDDLAGDGLAPYELRTVPITLTRDERMRYRSARSRFAVIFAEHARATGRGDWNDFVRAASKSPDTRAALEAWRSYRSLIAFSEGKRAALREILTRHTGERILVFTADNATAYTIARELLVMPVTHEIGRVERERVLARFRNGELPVLVSSQVLDEGLDVPDADVAVIVGGTASARRHVQRIGRVLRPRDGKRAIVYELSTGETTEAGDVRRRRAGFIDRRSAASEPRATYVVGARLCDVDAEPSDVSRRDLEHRDVLRGDVHGGDAHRTSHADGLTRGRTTAFRCGTRDPLTAIAWPFVLGRIDRPPRTRCDDVLQAAAGSDGGAR
jgi:superfamily II DNA or RNA helicase